ncbi:amino acid aminotransferase [Cumulibacter manganitolerans]|uniref:amino acid aminotransferase n=1 Tax=Cumulibacter manganitolerans TaxID=1884992 RepID=UPI0012957BE0|nr:amino acid aminotransferase [Cumulibacter manganitolerans]
MALFSSVTEAPRDPILGLTEAFNTDDNPQKVNLAVGVYYDDSGRIPLLGCVRAAEEKLAASPTARGYLPIDGMKAYDAAVKSLVFGDAVDPARISTVQTLGGTGALRVGADFLRQTYPGAQVLISDPSWENHLGVFARAGFEVSAYPYYDAASRGIKFDAMLATLRSAPADTVVVLHACCHNPTGYDLTGEQWDEVVAVVQERGLVPFLDMAYQGFGDGIAEDGAVIGKFAAADIDFLAATSFSKNFSLYGERVGGLSAYCSDAAEAARVLSQLKVLIRTNYSNPPTHGASVVATVLDDPQLRAQWEAELAGMRDRIRGVRASLVAGLTAAGVTDDLSYITTQRGMFSYSGLTREQMQRLRAEFGVYGLDTGRICVAAINKGNLDHVVRSMAAVING